MFNCLLLYGRSADAFWGRRYVIQNGLPRIKFKGSGGNVNAFAKERSLDGAGGLQTCKERVIFRHDLRQWRPFAAYEKGNGCVVYGRAVMSDRSMSLTVRGPSYEVQQQPLQVP